MEIFFYFFFRASSARRKGLGAPWFGTPLWLTAWPSLVRASATISSLTCASLTALAPTQDQETNERMKYVSIMISNKY
ncbi:hypothetical protein V2G26_009273 [Clonostachys chloroleuca]